MQASIHPFDAIKDLLTTMLIVDSLVLVVVYQIITSMDVSVFKQVDLALSSSPFSRTVTSCFQMTSAMSVIIITIFAIIVNILSQLSLYTASVVGIFSIKALIVAILANTGLTITGILGSVLMISQVFVVKFPLYPQFCISPNPYMPIQVMELYWNGTMIGTSSQDYMGVINYIIFWVLGFTSLVVTVANSYMLYRHRHKVEIVVVAS